VSLIVICQQHKIEPWAYLRDLFLVLPDWPAARVLKLEPKYWRQTSEQPHRGAHELMQRMRDYVVSLRGRRPELPVVLLADGGLRWKEMLLEGGSDGAQRVRDALDETGGRELRDADGKRPVHDAIRYLDNRAGRTDYASARARGLAIGSGAVEASCKSLVAIRMKRAGSRWKAPTGNEILTLRALHSSATDGRQLSLGRSSRSPRPSARPRRHRVAPPAEPPPRGAEGRPGRCRPARPTKPAPPRGQTVKNAGTAALSPHFTQ
jgi:hypothetical protein